MAVAPYGKRLLEECDSRGLAEVRRLRHVENHFHSLDQPSVDQWIAVKEAELRDESVSIARKALSNSRLATRIAISSIVLSIILAGQKVIEWYSK